MTLEELGKKAKFWCDLLGVDSNWDVQIGIGDTGNLQGCRGSNLVQPEYQSSRILIAPGESEETLVHEILHIIFDGHKDPNDDRYDPVYELGLNKVAKALSDLKNNSSKKIVNAKKSSAGTKPKKIKNTGKLKYCKVRNTSVTTRSS